MNVLSIIIISIIMIIIDSYNHSNHDNYQIIIMISSTLHLRLKDLSCFTAQPGQCPG